MYIDDWGGIFSFFSNWLIIMYIPMIWFRSFQFISSLIAIKIYVLGFVLICSSIYWGLVNLPNSIRFLWVHCLLLMLLIFTFDFLPSFPNCTHVARSTAVHKRTPAKVMFFFSIWFFSMIETARASFYYMFTRYIFQSFSFQILNTKHKHHVSNYCSLNMHWRM